MRKARMNRAVAATKCNEYSSRSHYVFQMKIYGENSVTGEKCESKIIFSYYAIFFSQIVLFLLFVEKIL